MLTFPGGIRAVAYATALTLTASALSAQKAGNEGGISAIREADLKADLFTLAGDGMRGREAGTLDELKASVWLAERARAAGLQPAGDDGTYYQWWNMRRVRQSSTSTVLLDGQPLRLWRDVALNGRADLTFSAPIAWIERADSAAIAQQTFTGKVAALQMSAPPNAPGRNVSLSSRRYATAAIQYFSRLLRDRGAVAILLVADATADSAFDAVSANSSRGTYNLDIDEESAGRGGRGGAAGGRGGGGGPNPSNAPVLWTRSSLANQVRSAQKLDVRLSTESFLYPSVNVVAKVPGSDPALRNQYVLFSAHQDHDGVRAPVDGDSIYNGADDNATVAVATLAIGRAFAARPARRSALFVWHGAEERGLLGSYYHAAHPLVPRDSIVAVLNADMIGRNGPDSASLMGVTPPHRNSTDLVNMALDANNQVSKFVIDSTWDRRDHPEGWYFRSDHEPYAQRNIPAVYFSSLLHADYHTPRDEPERINIAKLARITKWMFATGWRAANSDQRPRLDPGFQLERQPRHSGVPR